MLIRAQHPKAAHHSLDGIFRHSYEFNSFIGLGSIDVRIGRCCKKVENRIYELANLINQIILKSSIKDLHFSIYAPAFQKNSCIPNKLITAIFFNQIQVWVKECIGIDFSVKVLLGKIDVEQFFTHIFERKKTQINIIMTTKQIWYKHTKNK